MCACDFMQFVSSLFCFVLPPDHCTLMKGGLYRTKYTKQFDLYLGVVRSIWSGTRTVLIRGFPKSLQVNAAVLLHIVLRAPILFPVNGSLIMRTDRSYVPCYTNSFRQRFPTCAPRSPKGSACTSQGLRSRSRKIK